MKERMRSKVVLPAMTQLPSHPLARKAGLFFCQGFKEIRMARSEIFMTLYFSKLLPITLRDSNRGFVALRGSAVLKYFIYTPLLDPRAPAHASNHFGYTSEDFMGSLPKDPGQGKKLCGVVSIFCCEGRKGRKVWSGMTPMDVRDLCYTWQTVGALKCPQQ